MKLITKVLDKYYSNKLCKEIKRYMLLWFIDIRFVENKYSIELQVKKPEYDKTKLLDYITNLQQENEHLRTQVNTYENPDDYTLFYMWLDAKAKDKMKQLQEENERLKKENTILKENAEHNDKVVYKARYNEMIYKSRNGKAIEYINKNKHLNWYVESIFTDELLNILGGDE